MYPPPSYGPAYGQPPPDPRSSPYGDPYGMSPEMAHHAAPPPHPTDPHHQHAPPPAGHDPYASHYAAHYGYPPPEQHGYPPPGASQPPPGYPPPGYPPPDYHSYPPGHPPPPDGSYPPPADPHAAAHYAHYSAPPPPGYGAPPGYPPAYGAPPPPGYGYGYPPPMVPPGYGPPPGFGPPPGYPGRGPSPRRDRGRAIEDKKKRSDGGKGNNKNKDNKMQKKNDFVPGDARSKLQGWLQAHPGWIAVWLEGIDPPRRMASTPNVTTLLVAKFGAAKSGGAHELAFTFASTRNGLKKKDREKEAAIDLVKCFDQLPLQDFRAWYQLPTGGENRDIMPDDLERVTKAVRTKFVKATVDVPEPTSFVLVASMSAGPHEKVHGADADLALLEKFDAGFAELLREARRVSGLVRKQWYHAILWVKPEPGKDSQRPVALGIGFATDRGLARARAVYSAELRLPILTEAMFNKNVPEKPVPRKPVDGAAVAP